MFDLIVRAIAIGLASIAVTIGVYYGGAALTESTTRARALQALSAAQQIKDAALAHAAEPNPQPLDSLQRLVDWGYLTSIPAAPMGSWEMKTGEVSLPIGDSSDTDALGICLGMLKARSLPASSLADVPACASTLTQDQVCCWQ